MWPQGAFADLDPSVDDRGARPDATDASHLEREF